jgi:hypothetical protein
MMNTNNLTSLIDQWDQQIHARKFVTFQCIDGWVVAHIVTEYTFTTPPASITNHLFVL